MATRASPEAKQKGNNAESTKNSNIESRPKVNTNDVPRRSLLRQTPENSDGKSEPPKVTDNEHTEIQLSSPELDPITRGISIVSIDGPLSNDMVPSSMDGTMATNIQPSTSTSFDSPRPPDINKKMAARVSTEAEQSGNDVESTKKSSTDHSENSDTKSNLSRVTEPNHSHTQLSSPDVDWDADSAIGSDMNSVSSLTPKEDVLPTEMKWPTLQDSCTRSESTFSGQPTCVVPFVHVRPTRPVKIASTTPVKIASTKVQHTHRLYTEEQEKEAPLENASRQYCPINRGMFNVSIDGPQSDMDETMPTSKQPSTRSLVASHRLPDGMSDFVILHTDEDNKAVHSYMEHLLNDIGIPDLTVDSFSDIDAGKSQIKSLATLHENYRHILTYITDNLKSDKYCRFLQEIILTFGLREENGKEDRVVPVFTQEKYCGILEISIINGLQYFKYNTGSNYMKTKYIEQVKKLVKIGRTKFP